MATTTMVGSVPLVGVQRCPPLASRVLLIGDLASPLPPGEAIGEAHCAPVPTCHPCLKGKPISAPRLGCGRVSTIRWSITGRHTPRSCTGQAYDAAFQAGLMSPATLSAVAGSVQNHATPQELQLVPVGYAQSSPSQRRLPSGAPALISCKALKGLCGSLFQLLVKQFRRPYLQHPLPVTKLGRDCLLQRMVFHVVVPVWRRREDKLEIQAQNVLMRKWQDTRR
jgi:hypothetical protein